MLSFYDRLIKIGYLKWLVINDTTFKKFKEKTLVLVSKHWFYKQTKNALQDICYESYHVQRTNISNNLCIL